MLKRTLTLRVLMSKSLRSRMPALSIEELAADIDDEIIAQLEKRVKNLEKRLGFVGNSYKTPCPFCEGTGVVHSTWSGKTNICDVCRGEGFN